MGYQQEIEYRNLFDILDDGSIPFAWMRIESSLTFSDYIGAWKVLDTLDTDGDTLAASLVGMAEDELIRIVESRPIRSVINPMDMGLPLLFESIDPASTQRLELNDEVSASRITNEMIRLGSRGSVMSAVAVGLLISDHMDGESDSSVVRELALWMLESPRDDVLEWCRWFTLEANRVEPDQLAWMAARGGRPFLMYAALSDMDGFSEDILEEIMEDPPGYASSVPSPGSGSGSYAWVNTLDGGS
ncbi:hypothetical protein GF394_09005 [Candidatus Fermentibacteria bacterium]|nr:hypothetical protein [Candidatus Fermentibacteria bacterium]